jgi:hypothetical protein
LLPLRPSALHLAHLKRRLQPGEHISLRGELLAEVPVIWQVCYCTADSRIVELLLVVQVVAAGVTGRVEMPDVLDVVPDGPDNISLDLLHP